MKLKDRPLAWWEGKSFRYWCRADSKDERKIVYTLQQHLFGAVSTDHFTSEDDVNPIMLWRLRNSRIEKLQLIDNVWHVILNCYM